MKHVLPTNTQKHQYSQARTHAHCHAHTLILAGTHTPKLTGTHTHTHALTNTHPLPLCGERVSVNVLLFGVLAPLRAQDKFAAPVTLQIWRGRSF